jgi:hypothetical protein
LKEIRSFDRENNAELYESQKARRDEVLAAWKLRYYIEYLRLQTLKHVVDVVEGKNQELEEECGLLQQTSAVAEIENESLTKEIARLRDVLSVTEIARAALHEELQDTKASLDRTERQLRHTEGNVVQTSELIGLTKQAFNTEHERVVALESELAITRQTCQDLVRSCAKKETQVQDMSEELTQLRALHKAEQAEILLAREVHLQELEHAKMREEDNEIRYRKANDLYAVLNDRERTIRHLEATVASVETEVAALKQTTGSVQETVKREQGTVQTLEQEKAGLQKLLSELARRLTQADEEAIKHSVVERQHKVDAKTAQGVINAHLATIQDLEDQAAAAQSEIEFLVEENHELAREIECHHMYGEEMVTRYQHTFTSAERSMEYSRFLEEELFCARKLYEKTSTEYVEGSMKRAGGGAADTFGDVSEESYGYHRPEQEGAEGAGPPGERSKSFIEAWTGLDPVAPMVVHLNSFSKGARRSSRNRGGDFDRPSSAGMYNPDSRPNSSAPNSSLVAEQRLLMVLSQLEDKMKSVDRAADSLRFLAEKADAIEKVQATTANILNTHATAAALARQPVRLSEQMNLASARAAEEKQAHIDGHINMERVFSEMHVSLDQVNAQLAAQQEEMNQLQERRAECKNIMSNMKKLIKKSRKASTKDPEAAFLTEAQEGETETDMNRLSDEMEALKERINTYRTDNLDLNSRSIALQTELYHLDQNLERSAADFLHMYGEHIAAYYPPELAHLIENAEGHSDDHGHGHVSLPSPVRQLNTLYEEDEWSESVGNGGEGSNESVGGGSIDTMGPGGFSPFDPMPAPGEGGGSLEESDLEAPFSEDSPSMGGKSRKHHRKASKMDSGGGSEKHRKGSKMDKLARKVSKMQKLAKKARKASALEAGSTEGSTYDTGAALLEEGSSELNSGAKAGSLDQLPGDHERGVVLGGRQPLSSTTSTAGGIALLGSPQHYHGRSPMAPGGGSPGPVRVSRVGTSGDTHADRAARLQIQQARERLAQLRTQLEQSTAGLDAALDEIDVIEGHRAEFRAEIVRWVDHFHSLCGYFPEVSDKLRSSTLKPSLDNCAAAQAHLEEVHASAVEFYNEAHALRSALIEEQHQQARTIPLEQIAEQMQLLYPISDFSVLLLEDPLHIRGSEEEPESVAEGAAAEGTVADEGPDDAATQAEGAEQLDPELMKQMARALAVFGGNEDSAADVSEERPDLVQQATLRESFLRGPPSLYAASTTSTTADIARTTAAVGGSVRPGPTAVSTSSDVHDEATFQDAGDPSADKRASSGGHGPTADTPSQMAVTPFVTAVAAFNESDANSVGTWSEVSLKMAKSVHLEALFASSDETPEALLAENKRLRRELRVWNSDYQRLYGHKPAPADFDTFDDIIKAKIFRKNHIAVLLEAAVKEGRITAEALEGGTSTRTAHAHAPASVIVTVNPSSKPGTAESDKPATADSSFSVPATPYNAGLGATRPDLRSLPTEYSSSFQQTGQWAGMFADSAEETTAALVAEHAQIKRDLRLFAQQYQAVHGHPPSPEYLAHFPAAIQEKIFRKGQLKKLLAERAGVDGEVHGGASSPTKGASQRLKSPSAKATVTIAGSATESSVGGPSSRGRSPKHPASNPHSKSSSRKAKGALSEQHHRDGDNSDSAHSFPTTPFMDRYAQLSDAQSVSTADFSFSSKVSKSSKFASLFPDPTTASQEALLEEQRQVKATLRRWAVDFMAQHGRKPEPHEYEDFDEEIKRLIFRKNQLKMHFAAQSADAPVSVRSRGGERDRGLGGVSGSGSRAAQGSAGKEKKSTPHTRSRAKPDMETESQQLPSAVASPPETTESIPTTALIVVGPPVHTEGMHQKATSASKKSRKAQSPQVAAAAAEGAADMDDRAGTAVSTTSAYSVPTTPFTTHLHGGMADAGEESIDGYGADMSVRISVAPQAPRAPGAQSTAAASAEVPVQAMQEELKKLKRDLRRWNASFVQQHGRNPSADDFETFDEATKAMLLRKSQLKEQLDNAVASDRAGAATSVGYAAADVGPTSANTQPSTDETASLEETLNNAAREMAELKQHMKSWQKDFVARNKRDPQRQDLTPDILSMGERRDALRQLLTDHNRADLASSRSAKQTPPISPSSESRVTAGVALAGPPAASAAAAAMTAGASEESGVDRAVSPRTPTNKRVSFIAREQGAADAAPYDPPVAIDEPVGLTAAAQSGGESATTDTAQPTIESATGTDSGFLKMNPALEQLSAAELSAEYSRVKKALKQWQRDFEAQHGREPGDADFDNLDEVFKDLVVRKYEIKALLGDEAGAAGSGQSSRSAKKSKKSSKSHKHAAEQGLE